MASIGTQIKIYDVASAPLMKITNAVYSTISAVETLDNTVNSSFDSSKFDYAREQLNAVSAELIRTEQNVSNNVAKQNQFNDSLHRGTQAAGGLTQKILGLVGAYAGFQGFKKIINLADTMTQTTARLNLMNDGLQTTEELQNKIMASANRSRAVYQTTADMISKLGMQAGKAFSSNDELIAFTEQLNKSFVIAGTDAQGVESVMYNLTQALASGVLRGQDLNAVMSNAMPIIQNVADYLDVPVGKIRDMAAKGKLSASVVKNAMLAAAAETNATFEQIPMTWGQLWIKFSNTALKVFEPVLDKLGKLANSSEFETMVTGATQAMIVLGDVASGTFDVIVGIARFVINNWSMMGPVIMGVATAVLVYKGYLTIANIVEAVSIGLKKLSIIATYAKAAATRTATDAILAETAAQQGLNVALLACPVTWIVVAIIALIAVFYFAIAAVNKFAGTSYSATGMIAGAFTWLFGLIGNIVMAAYNFIFDTVANIWNTIAAFAEFLANVFIDPIGSIVRLFSDLRDVVLSVLQSIAGMIDTVFGSNLAGAVGNWRSELSSKVIDIVGEAKFKIPRMDASAMRLERMSLTDMYGKGYNFGKNIQDKVSNFGMGKMFDDLLGETAATAINTKAIKDSANKSGKDLEYLRDIAEREVINRFTTAEVKVDFGGVTNNVSSEMDLDGVVSYIAEGVGQAIEIAAEGVH